MPSRRLCQWRRDGRYFGKGVHQALGGSVPIGLVSSNVGGTAVERWSGPDATTQCNQTGVVQQSNLWTPYIVPLLPLQMSGWIWWVRWRQLVAWPAGWLVDWLVDWLLNLLRRRLQPANAAS